MDLEARSLVSGVGCNVPGFFPKLEFACYFIFASSSHHASLPCIFFKINKNIILANLIFVLQLSLGLMNPSLSPLLIFKQTPKIIFGIFVKLFQIKIKLVKLFWQKPIFCFCKSFPFLFPLIFSFSSFSISLFPILQIGKNHQKFIKVRVE